MSIYGNLSSVMSPLGSTGPQYNARTANGMGLGVTGDPNFYPGLLDPYQNLNMVSRNRASVTGGQVTAQDVMPTVGPTGLYIDPRTGRPFTGTAPDGRTYSAGRPTGEPVPYSPGKTINPNDPNQRYQAVNIDKSPPISEATKKMLAQWDATTNAGLQNFNAILDVAKNQLPGANAKVMAATDIAPLAETLRAQQAAYSSGLGQLPGRYQTINDQAKAALEGVNAQETADLALYDQKMQDLQAQSLGYATQGRNARKSVSGTPGSWGSSDDRQALADFARISVPIGLAEVGKRYDVLGNIRNTALDTAGRATSLVANFDPMIAAQQFQSGQATEMTIQQLTTAAAQAGYANVQQYIQDLLSLNQYPQKYLSGSIGQEGALADLYSKSRYQSVQDILGANITPAQSYNMSLPGYSGPSRYSGTGGTGTGGGMQASNAPVQVGPGNSNPPAGAQGDWVWDGNNQRWQNWKTGAVSTTGPWQQNESGRYANAATGALGYDPGYEEWLSQFQNV